MFENIGRKIKGLTKIICWVGIIASVVAAIAMMSMGDDILLVIGIIMLVVGPIMSWVSSFIMYGFGELVDRTTSVEQILSGGQPMSSGSYPTSSGSRPTSEGSRPLRPMVDPSKFEQDRKEQLEKLRSQGLISEDEYRQAISK